jgi:hypothetical protein
MSILDRFLDKKLVLKVYFIENGIKFYRYKTNPDFITEKDGIEEKRNIENASLEGISPIEGSANSAHNITTDINLDTATTAQEQPDLTGKPPLEDDTAAADVLSPENIKKALLAIDGALFLKVDFYSRAAAFMSLYYLDKGYLA